MPKVVPALFPPLFGFVALGLLWQAQVLPLVGWLAALIWLAAAAAYVGRVVQNADILARDLDTLPGRTGLTAMNLTLMLVAGLVGQVSLVGGKLLLALAILVQLALIFGFLARVRRDKALRVVQPVWQMIFTGFVVAIPATATLAGVDFAKLLLGFSVAMAALLWGLTAVQLVLKRFPPPQLRPPLAIHLSPAAMIGQGALAVGYTGLADGFLWVSIAIFVALILSIRWLTEYGFSPFWGAFTFPLVGLTGLVFAFHPTVGWALLALSTLVVGYVLARVFVLWRSGKLAVLTFAAV